MLEAAFDLERNQGLAHGRTRHAELLRQFALGGQLAADGIFAIVDKLAQLVGDLPV